MRCRCGSPFRPSSGADRVVGAPLEHRSYPVPAGPVDAEIEINRSRFVTWLRPVRSRDDVSAVLEAARRAHPGATHHCYAYLLGSPDSGEASMSDDGEPSGTAGRPIFTVLGHKRVGDAMVVVIRYFGGIKLGAGGLVRAYMAAAESVLSRMEVVTQVPVSRVTLRAPFAAEQAIRHWSSGHGVTLGDVSYGEGVTIELTVPQDEVNSLASFCAASGIEWSTND